MTRSLDATDLRMIAELRRQPRASLVQLAQAVKIARGTAYSRLERLESEGVISGYGPEIDAISAGLGVMAFATLDIAQGSHAKTTSALAKIAEILEIHTVTGVGDLHCKIVARSNDHLHEILQQIAGIATVLRSQTQLALSTSLQRTVADLLSEQSQP